MRNSVCSAESNRNGLQNEANSLRRYFALYTALFAGTCLVVFGWYFLTGRTFIWQVDGWHQHYKALAYYAEYLRSIFRELFYNHRLVIPAWDFALGEGNDILQTLHYYVIGDPFSVLAVLVPTRFLWIYYDFMILLRLYLSGIAFSRLCFYTKKTLGKYAVLAGALSYVFCGWAIYTANRHPYFLNPLLYFPLIVLGVEKILHKEKPYVLIASVFLAAISNFYFFYCVVLVTVVYVIVRLVTKYRTDLRSMSGMLLRIAGGSVLGTAMAAVILLPMLYAFVQDGRMDSGLSLQLVYPMSYYSELPGKFLYGGGTFWAILGYAAPVVPAAFLLFLRRGEHRLLKICFVICWIILLVPALGQIFNGMSYMSNKWCWAFALLCAYMLSVMWPELMALSPNEVIKLAVFCGIWLLLAVFWPGLYSADYSHAWASAACIGVALLFLLAVFPFRWKNPRREAWWKTRRQTAALALVILSVGLVSLVRNAPFADHYAQEAIYAGDAAEQLLRSEAYTVEQTAAADGITDFYRYSGRGLTYNAGLLHGISCTSYYWSISNPAVGSFRTTMAVREPLLFFFQGYDDRAALLTLSSVEYFVVPDGDEDPIPYGFTYLEDADSPAYKVYRNQHALPLSYVYDTVISEEHWNGLSPVEKQEAMLQSVVLAGFDGETQDDAVVYGSRSQDYTIVCDDEWVTLRDHGFAVVSEGASVTFRFDGLADSETYFSISGLTYEGDDSVAYLQLLSSSGVSKTIESHTEAYTWYNNRHDFTANLGYGEDTVTSITLTFSAAGFYSFDSIEVACQPMDCYAEQVAALRETALQDVEIGTDTLRGSVSLERRGILCFSIPYSAGWTAYVDGEEATLYQANVKNMALVLDAGDHDVELVYHTPYLRLGAGLSAAGFAVFFALLLLNVYRKRRAARNEKESLQ